MLAAGSLRLDEIIDAQARTGVWNAFAQPLGFIVFVVAAFAEAARLPFDLPGVRAGTGRRLSHRVCRHEAAAVSGRRVPAHGRGGVLDRDVVLRRLASFVGACHRAMVDRDVASHLDHRRIVRMLVLHAKILLVIVFFMMVRWSWPRFRFDQLMDLAWKVMLPLGLVNFTAVAIFEELRDRSYDPVGTIGSCWTLRACRGGLGRAAVASSGRDDCDRHPLG